MLLMNRKGVPTYPQLRDSNFSSFILSWSGCTYTLYTGYDATVATSSVLNGWKKVHHHCILVLMHRFPSPWKVGLWLTAWKACQ